MKYLERRRRIMRRDTVEIIPVAADSAVIVRLAAKIEPAKRRRGKLRNRALRKQAMVTRSVRLFWQVMRAMRFNRM